MTPFAYIEPSPKTRLLWLALALGCLLAYARAFAAGFAGSLPMGGFPEMEAFSDACSAARVGAIVLAMVVGCAFRWSIGRGVALASGVAMAISAVALAGGPTLAEGLPFAIIAGLSSGIAMLALMMLMASLGVREIVLASFGGLLIGGLLIGAIMALDPLLAMGILVFSGLVAGGALPLAEPSLASCRADGLPTAAQVVGFPWFAAVAFVVCGVVASLLYGASVQLGWRGESGVNHALFGVAVVIVLGATAYIVLQGEEAAASSWIPLFGVLAFAMVAACFDETEVQPSVTGLLLAAVFCFHFLRWMVLPALIASSHMPRLFTCGLLLLFASGFFGVGWGMSMATALPDALHAQGAFVAVVSLMLLVLFAAALVVNRSQLEAARMRIEVLQEDAARALEEAAEAAGAGDPKPTHEERCKALAQEFGLTARESEILELTGRGHSSTYIAEQLVVSASTVRFHQQNIYRKLGVHSRQELLALVNGEGSSR